MSAWARERVSWRAKCLSTNQSLRLQLTEPRCRTGPGRQAGKTWSVQLQRRLLPAADGSGGGGQREACDSWGPRTPKSHKGMGDREASAPSGTTHRGARSEEGVLQSNRVASVCARGHYKPSFIRRGYGVTLSAMLWPPVEDGPKTLFSWELCFPDTDSSSRPLVLPRNQVSTPFLSLERMMALRNTPLEE